MRLIARLVLLCILALSLSVAASVSAEDFDQKMARVDQALRDNPSKVGVNSLNTCLRQRNFAARLYEYGETERAERSINYCFHVLRIPKNPPKVEVAKGPTMEEIQQRAAREIEQALELTPDTGRGLEIYRGCAECHTPEGWGMKSGLVPQLAGQHNRVLIKQLADIRAGYRQSVIMAPYATVEVIGGVQSIADVAAYIDTLEISTAGGKGPGDNLQLGERLYRENCVSCHGENGEGDAEKAVPRIQAQHYRYLVRQFELIRDGERRNANEEMRQQIAKFKGHEIRAVMDYVSRLEPPEELVAPEGWVNPDFIEVTTMVAPEP